MWILINRPEVKLQCILSCKFGLWSLFLSNIWACCWGWGSSWSSTQFIRFCRRKHSTLWKMRIKSSCRKGWIGPQLMWLHSWEYMACLAQCTEYLYRWVPYGRANVASYQHLIQIASCSFNEVAFQLGGLFPEIGKISQPHTCAMNREHTVLHNQDML